MEKEDFKQTNKDVPKVQEIKKIKKTKQVISKLPDWSLEPPMIVNRGIKK